jgi:hypothetical protein
MVLSMACSDAWKGEIWTVEMMVEMMVETWKACGLPKVATCWPLVTCRHRRVTLHRHHARVGRLARRSTRY